MDRKQPFVMRSVIDSRRLSKGCARSYRVQAHVYVAAWLPAYRIYDLNRIVFPMSCFALAVCFNMNVMLKIVNK